MERASKGARLPREKWVSIIFDQSTFGAKRGGTSRSSRGSRVAAKSSAQASSVAASSTDSPQVAANEYDFGEHMSRVFEGSKIGIGPAARVRAKALGCKVEANIGFSSGTEITSQGPIYYAEDSISATFSIGGTSYSINITNKGGFSGSWSENSFSLSDFWKVEAGGSMITPVGISVILEGSVNIDQIFNFYGN